MSSFIVLGIVAIWILVLVPMWLNRHDSDSASRSMDSFSTAMRVLSRRTAARADRRYLVMRRDDWGITVDNEPETSTGRRPLTLRLPVLRLPTRRQRYAPLSGRARLLARRRRIALFFAVLTIGLAVSAAVFHTSWWFELGAGVALAAYVVHLRTDAIRAAEMRRRRLVRTAREAAPRMSSRMAAGDYRYAARDLVAEAEPEVSLVGAVSASGTENGSRWEPVAVPLPTYVSKPVVSRPAAAAPKADAESGTIDLTRPGVWVDSQVDVRHLLEDDDELAAIISRRRAVND
ncbi:MAG TPA: hypothetical protein VGD55_07715 [Acidothermaceae bacterium]